MRSLAISSAIAATAIAVMSANPASAQASRTWVSGVGDDVNPCSRTAPCKTFAGAISKTAINGEINCLDPAGYGAVTITKSMTIDCHWTHGSILSGVGVNGIVINIAANANDPLRTVRLRGLTISGTGVVGGVGGRQGVRGISGLQYSNLFIDDLVVTQFAQQGINVGTSVAGARTFIRNTVVRDNTLSGISSAGAATHSMVIENVHSLGNAFGVAAGSGNNVMIKRSVMSGNSTAGVQADSGSQMNVDDTVLSHNSTGVVATGTVRLSNNDISFNSTAVSGAGSTSFGNNRIAGNSAAGTTPTQGAASSDHGQQ